MGCVRSTEETSIEHDFVVAMAAASGFAMTALVVIANVVKQSSLRHQDRSPHPSGCLSRQGCGRPKAGTARRGRVTRRGDCRGLRPRDDGLIRRFRNAAAACLFLAVASAPATAANLTVTHWADGMYGAPFAVALEKGYFKEAGVDVAGFITSQGGGTTVRNAMASEIPYGEVALPAAIAAFKQGVDLTIVHGGVLSLADIYWVAKADSPLNSIADLKGKKLGYSSPKSVTDMVSTIALTKAGILATVERKTVGSLNGAMTALREGAVDVVYMTEPVYSREKANLKVVFKSADMIPNATQTVGIVRTDYLKQHPEVIRAIIAARRKGVDYIGRNPAESGEILAKHYKIPADVAKTAINGILAAKGTYWSPGKLDYEGMNAMLDGLIIVKAIDPGKFDWTKIVNESLLPADQRSK